MDAAQMVRYASTLKEFSGALSNWKSAIVVIMTQELNQRAKGDKLRLILEFAEPLIVIAVLMIVREFLKGKLPVYGTSLLLFYASGVLPFYLFLFLSRRIRSVEIDPQFRLPRVTTFDAFVARAMLEIVIWIVVMSLLFCAMWSWGILDAKPRSMSDLMGALSLMIILAVGIGLINSVIVRFFPLWTWVYGACMRCMLILSGVHFVVDLMPFWLRSWAVWSPMMHGIEWFRVGVYGFYPHMTLDAGYLAKCAVVALALGIIADRATLRYIGR